MYELLRKNSTSMNDMWEPFIVRSIAARGINSLVSVGTVSSGLIMGVSTVFHFRHVTRRRAKVFLWIKFCCKLNNRANLFHVGSSDFSVVQTSQRVCWSFWDRQELIDVEYFGKDKIIESTIYLTLLERLKLLDRLKTRISVWPTKKFFSMKTKHQDIHLQWWFQHLWI